MIDDKKLVSNIFLRTIIYVNFVEIDVWQMGNISCEFVYYTLHLFWEISFAFLFLPYVIWVL